MGGKCLFTITELGKLFQRMELSKPLGGTYVLCLRKDIWRPMVVACAWGLPITLSKKWFSNNKAVLPSHHDLLNVVCWVQKGVKHPERAIILAGLHQCNPSHYWWKAWPTSSITCWGKRKWNLCSVALISQRGDRCDQKPALILLEHLCCCSHIAQLTSTANNHMVSWPMQFLSTPTLHPPWVLLSKVTHTFAFSRFFLSRKVAVPLLVVPILLQ